ncbi:hypothetical protein [Actinomadura harenae]|uniref:CU044_5270 family protein n=1 Tax=Actinomadura harenae TaxID=2483351 RepID=A0A3M2M3Q4_9ACTN|nr:hypothetical protein [Actinomadura harenae]RMI44052.1 hypothetical protein EBO15_14115 [Actinomadura harenae]
MIRSLLAQAPPSAEVTAEGRRRVLSQAEPRHTPRKAMFRLSLAAAGIAAVTAAALLMSGGSPTTPPTARQVLLTAAEKTASAPVGRFWHTHVINGQAYYVAQGDYVITGARMEIDQWIGRTDQDGDAFRSRFAGAYPQTSADQAAWRRAGSPETWSVLSNGSQIKQTTDAEPWDTRRTTPTQKKQASAFFASAAKRCATKPQTCPRNRPPSPTEREALANDKTALQQALRKGAGQGGPESELTGAAYLLTQPGSPKLAAAIFQALADTPGIRNAGTVKDTGGRKALALAARASDPHGTFDTELLLDPATYRVLGTQTVLVSGTTPETRGMKPGTVYTQQLFLEMGWTNTAPQ